LLNGDFTVEPLLRDDVCLSCGRGLGFGAGIGRPKRVGAPHRSEKNHRTEVASHRCAPNLIADSVGDYARGTVHRFADDLQQIEPVLRIPQPDDQIWIFFSPAKDWQNFADLSGIAIVANSG
jgi:hypothetical protein